MKSSQYPYYLRSQLTPALMGNHRLCLMCGWGFLHIRAAGRRVSLPLNVALRLGESTDWLGVAYPVFDHTHACTARYI